ncbi:hypothetical protein, partial [Desulfurobacterium sp.]|uniref:hypothetical protein n=1 Tax=Desulfurobacterium sp. TaxID=2004706 RepID=UPI0026198225
MIEVAGNNLVTLIAGGGGLVVGGVLGFLFCPKKKEELKVQDDVGEKVDYLISKVESIGDEVRKAVQYRKEDMLKKAVESLNRLSVNVDNLITELENKSYPENIVYALRDVSSRIKSISIDESFNDFTKEVNRIESILREVENKIENNPGIPVDLKLKIKELNRKLLEVDLKLLSELIDKPEGSVILKKIDSATLLSKEIA